MSAQIKDFATAKTESAPACKTTTSTPFFTGLPTVTVPAAKGLGRTVDLLTPIQVPVMWKERVFATATATAATARVCALATPVITV
jgi:hypothetical protein